MNLFGRPKPIDAADSTYEGVSAAYARADHRHGMSPALLALLARIGVSSSSSTTNVTNTTVTGSVIEQVYRTTVTNATFLLPDVTTATISYLTLGVATATLVFPPLQAGKSLTLVAVQDATGGRLITWDPLVVWAAGTAPTLTTAAGKRDVFSFMCGDGATWLAFTAGQNYS